MRWGVNICIYPLYPLPAALLITAWAVLRCALEGQTSVLVDSFSMMNKNVDILSFMGVELKEII